MGKDFAESYPAARAIFDHANEVLGYDLATICFEGPPETLAQTDIQQPAIFTTSVAIWRALDDGQALGFKPHAMAGLSLGEYTALYAAGSVSFADALRLVQRRGQLMQDAARAIPSSMVSVLMLEADQVQEICRQASACGVIVPANYNCPGQIVISGERAACEKAITLIEKAGGSATLLPVAGAFHSPIMQPAADGLAEMLRRTTFRVPNVDVIANVDCQAHRTPDTIRTRLIDQLTAPVLWQRSMEHLLERGVGQFVEIGPGRVLSGLIRRISRRTPVLAMRSVADLAELAVAS
jgi:[acyl-carrier-protein] S-malonyltransferase